MHLMDSMHVTCCCLAAEFLSDYEAKLTAGYSQTYTSGQNAGVTVTTQTGQHGTVTAGMLCHDTLHSKFCDDFVQLEPCHDQLFTECLLSTFALRSNINASQLGACPYPEKA